MHTPLLVGMLAFFAVLSVSVGLLFLRAWTVRREDRQYLVFGFLNGAIAVHAALGALIYGSAVGLQVGFSDELLFTWLVVPSKAAVALTFHYALIHARVRRRVRLVVPVYVLMGAFAVLGLTGGWWQHRDAPIITTILGISLHYTAAVPSAAALPFYVVGPVLVVVCIVLFGYSYFASGDGLGAFVGSILLGLAAINDLALGAGWFETIPLFALGFLALTYGVALTLVSRYANTTHDLRVSTETLQGRSLELGRAFEDLRRTQQDLVRSKQLAVVGELAAVIAHEVRNPLAIVANAVASLRKRHTTGDDRRTLLEIISEEMGRLDALVGRLIHYARPVVLDAEDLDLEEVARRSSAVVVGADLVVEHTDDLPKVSGDAALLRQVFENLFSNAVQAAGTRPIRVRFSQRNVGGVSAVAAEVSDEGEGMTTAQLESALTPFFTTRPTGTGLGLPIVARIVEAHGGQVQIRSARGEGTTVTVIVPMARGRRSSKDKPRRISWVP